MLREDDKVQVTFIYHGDYACIYKSMICYIALQLCKETLLKPSHVIVFQIPSPWHSCRRHAQNVSLIILEIKRTQNYDCI